MRNECNIDLKDRSISFANQGLTVELYGLHGGMVPVRVVIQDTVQIPGFSEMELMANLEKPLESGVWMTEGEHEAVMVAHSVVEGPTTQIPIRLLNSMDGPITLYKGKKVATLLPAETVANVSSSSPLSRSSISASHLKILEQLVADTGESLSEANKEKLLECLIEYADIFAVDKNDFGRTDKVQHQMDTGGAPPVRQQVRRVPPAL